MTPETRDTFPGVLTVRGPRTDLRRRQAELGRHHEGQIRL